MSIQERKRYNLIILVLFITGFLLFGGMSLFFWMPRDMSFHYEVLLEQGIYEDIESIPEFSDVLPFEQLPTPLRQLVILTIYGLGGGWFITGMVGGFWLGLRFIMKQNKTVVILACVFFMITWVVIMYVGIFVTIPYAIYNVIKIRKEKLSPEVMDWQI